MRPEYHSFHEKKFAQVSIDNQLKLYNDKIREVREKRGDITETIMEHASNNNLLKSVIQISDGKLKITETKVQEPLTFKYLEKSLGEVIKNESQVKQILEYLKTKREYKFVPEIKRFSAN